MSDEIIVDDVLNLWRIVSSGSRGNWENHWQEVAERMLPAFSNQFRTQMSTDGEKRNEFIFDSTASVALNRFASILDSLLTPRNQKWHSLTSSHEELNKNRQVRLYFEAVNKTLFKQRYAPSANFSAQNQMNYKSLGAFGSACMFIDDIQPTHAADVARGLRYKSCHLGQVYFMENHQGIIDTVVRHFPMEARQAAQKWGIDNLPDNIKTALDKAPDREFFFIHCVKPRENYDPQRLDSKGLPLASYYVSVEGSKLMSEGGYESFPYATSRYEQAPGEFYGRSPAMEVLPAVKTLNEQKKTVLKQGHRVVDPVLLAHDDGVIDTFSLQPGHIQAGGVSKEGRPLIHALPVGNLAAGKDMMDDERAIINDSFLVTLFQILVDTPAMTATEVMERTREKGILLAPTIGRQQSEYLGPMIERELDVLSRQGMLPEMPQILVEAGADFDIIYDSPLSKAQRAEESAGLFRSLDTILNVVNITGNPEPLDHYNWDVIVPEISDINSVPMKWRHSAQNIQSMRKSRAEQAQMQQAIEAAPGQAALTRANKP